MQASSSARKAWDETMAQMGQGPRAKEQVKKTRRRGKRASGKFRESGGQGGSRVDEETRRQIRNSQLELYEADNYKSVEDDAGEEEYEDISDSELPTVQEKRNPKRQKKSGGKKNQPRKVKNFVDVLLKEGVDTTRPNYFSASVGPPSYPTYRMCAVCGGPAKMVEKKTNARVCSSACRDFYLETKGMRMG
eukprot:gb/GECG01002538.1/.p1 GENE.gb/GECG01002538.1/~~gb/GECG01002538.1/.p1  ORF type:complete len:191 (+),score=31.31 gb/GECG01002538.1/:1-573(+)